MKNKWEKLKLTIKNYFCKHYRIREVENMFGYKCQCMDCGKILGEAGTIDFSVDFEDLPK